MDLIPITPGAITPGGITPGARAVAFGRPSLLAVSAHGQAWAEPAEMRGVVTSPCPSRGRNSRIPRKRDLYERGLVTTRNPADSRNNRPNPRGLNGIETMPGRGYRANPAQLFIRPPIRAGLKL